MVGAYIPNADAVERELEPILLHVAEHGAVAADYDALERQLADEAHRAPGDEHELDAAGLGSVQHVAGI